MGFLFGRKKKGDDKEKDEEEQKKRGLGIFSPAIDKKQSDPQHEFRRLAELDRIFIRSKKLESLDDVPFIVNQVKNGNIVLLDIGKLNDGRDQTHLELKRIIERIRGETRTFHADLALVNDNCVIVTPAFVDF